MAIRIYMPDWLEDHDAIESSIETFIQESPLTSGLAVEVDWQDEPSVTITGTFELPAEVEDELWNIAQAAVEA